MSRARWHILSEPGRYTLARHLPPRFDVVAEAIFPPADPARLAQQIRQDLWRLLQRLRGFSPVVQVSATEGGLIVRAGGRSMVAQTYPKEIESQIQTLLQDPQHRLRWLAWAKTRRAA
ncbi:hypothetical protein [Pseudoprimorskyibacter insulae]|uniref:Uncharacterized protein n=1 Tax=Pseudoprimorskyibacter insulae TaxID=1695997 RepID=A0A2R8AQN0_9RHOB|nr:hypothetical protein [Pseudoprimorskyibacter insulae]SPF78325.1 hypothetical protein PRI8871_00921 [Pseudoprimorskyibacter insulae]